ncbi:hypothetical protein HDU93_006696 [Gonapodya sp. JEL0774]|nr:hypothetical protein HDU93_006696 [Gonapodya sp. JEL0774]
MPFKDVHPDCALHTDNGFRAGIDIIGPVTYSPEGKVIETHSHGHIGANKLSVCNLAVHAIQGRGVMVDLEKHFGREKRYVSYGDLMKVMEEDNVIVEKGDLLFFHTGFAQSLIEMNGNPDPHVLHNTCCGLDGRDPDLLRWITDSGVAALISDNYAVEQLPARPPPGDAAGRPHASMPLHEHALFRVGINLGEIWQLTELAVWLREHNRNRFFVTCPGLNLPGAVGCPPCAVATV